MSSSPKKQRSGLQQRAEKKAQERRATAYEIASGKLTPGEAQKRAAPIQSEVKIVDLWGAINRHVAGRGRKKKKGE